MVVPLEIHATTRRLVGALTLALVTFIVWYILSAGPALAQTRVALVIGNSAYRHTSTLKNPNNDATDVANVLRRLGFAVTYGADLDKKAMEGAIDRFANQLGGAELAVFFYAGHGLQVSGENYLVPIDAPLATERTSSLTLCRCTWP